MGPDVPANRWLRRGRWAAALVAIACCTAGSIWIYRSATVGDVLGAAAAAGLCLGIVALGALAVAAFRLGGLTLRCMRQAERLEARLTALELSTERTSRTMDLVTDENVDAASLAAATLERDTFPRLSAAIDHQDQEKAVLEDHAPAEPGAAEPTAASSDGQQELDRLVHREMKRLRDEFADLVRGRDYAGALHTGERIATLFPDSALAREFESIRAPLARRAAAIGSRRADESAEAV
jgi:hypothetical protein